MKKDSTDNFKQAREKVTQMLEKLRKDSNGNEGRK
jgi:hypothetical protein